MQPCRNDVLSAPTSFLALASLRHAVRLACFAAASPEGAAAGVADGFAAAGAGAVGAGVAGAGVVGAGVAGVSAICVGGAAASPPAAEYSPRHTAATVGKRIY